MKNSKIVQVFAVSAALTCVAACGGGGGGDGGGKPPETSGNGPGDPSGQPADPNALTLDMDMLLAVNNNVLTASGKDTAWTVRVVINGTEKSRLEQASFADVSDALKALTLKRDDVFRLEMTIVDKANPSLVLATNLADVAAADASLKSVWDGQCSTGVSPEVKITDGGLWNYQSQGSATGRVSLQICDFAGVTLKPMVVIKPQAQILDKKTVIYHCAVKPSTSTNELYAYTDNSCPYGYVTEAGETAPTISILKDFAPGEPLYTTKILVLDGFKLNLSNAGTIQLKTDFYAPPFGSHEGCHTTKVDVKYGTPEGIKAARLTFKRQPQSDGSVIWMPQNGANWPAMSAIKNYYAQAGAEEKLDIYRICDWIPSMEDSQAGGVMQFSVN